MATHTTHFDKISLLVTHFNRSKSLERLLSKLREHGVSFAETIVSDGGSNSEHLRYVNHLRLDFGFTLLTTTENKGLGNSINVGQDAAKTPYILYIQEDFVPKSDIIPVLTDAFNIMEHEEEWDIIRFYAFPWARFPYLKPYKKGFSEMVFHIAPWYTDHTKFFAYSDHPHLKRRSFPEKFGRYYETLSGDVTEMKMCRSFLRHKGKGLYYHHDNDLFEHDNPLEEPGQVREAQLKRQRLRQLPALRWAYLKYRMLRDTVLLLQNK
ncbi:glycosyltransferase [Parapedobacter sp. ISTM3]|uniref:Glycosyltransferase involved in cell wall bisynthesis n=1 Tax=Parapedobacter luteus TaxID=623280 RepID=A0A1T5C728_9SPHI|nr:MULTISPECIES: glycosyltransferase [Parapedobacter]MBK1439219.1 glycosyltransferase [Parapedobacter sp. ISTM3]SKB54930.1 Glycosyltransferase involved in cell wall bisynthesis [Parapedobacter luteus]